MDSLISPSFLSIAFNVHSTAASRASIQWSKGPFCQQSFLLGAVLLASNVKFNTQHARPQSLKVLFSFSLFFILIFPFFFFFFSSQSHYILLLLFCFFPIRFLIVAFLYTLSFLLFFSSALIYIFFGRFSVGRTTTAKRRWCAGVVLSVNRSPPSSSSSSTPSVLIFLFLFPLFIICVCLVRKDAPLRDPTLTLSHDVTQKEGEE